MTNNKEVKNKTRYDMLPWDAIKELAEVSMFGAEKYGDHNWKVGIEYTTYWNAAMRHLTAWINGEDNASDSNKSHLAHAAWNCLAILHLQMNGVPTDDRFIEQNHHE